MDCIFLNSNDFNYPILNNNSYESKVYYYNDNYAMKIFKTDNTDILNNKLAKIEILNSIKTNDVISLALVFIDGSFKGYLSKLRDSYSIINSLKQNKKLKYDILKKVLEKIEYYHSLGIIYGDLHEKNILFDKTNQDVILCDLDNSHIGIYDFDSKSYYENIYLNVLNVSEKLDYYMFNILTISYIKRISYAYIFDYLKFCGLTKEFNTKENWNILHEMFYLNNDFSGDLFINHIKRRILF